MDVWKLRRRTIASLLKFLGQNGNIPLTASSVFVSNNPTICWRAFNLVTASFFHNFLIAIRKSSSTVISTSESGKKKCKKNGNSKIRFQSLSIFFSATGPHGQMYGISHKKKRKKWVEMELTLLYHWGRCCQRGKKRCHRRKFSICWQKSCCPLGISSLNRKEKGIEQKDNNNNRTSHKSSCL